MHVDVDLKSVDKYYPPQWHAHHPHLRGFRPNAGSEHEPMESTWLDK